MWYLQKHVALSRELLFCDTASLCQLHEAYQVILPQIGKVLDLFEHVMVKKDQNREKCSCLIFFFLLIFQPQTKHLWGYWKSQLWYKKMFLLKILSQFFWAGVVCSFLKESVSLGQCSMNGVEIWSVCPRVTPIPWDSVLRYSLPYFSLLFYCGYSN